MSGTTGNDNVTLTSGNDTFNGGAGADTIYGIGGNDTIRGDGTISVSGGTQGADYVDGGTGNDVLFGGAGTATGSGGAGDGNDTLIGGDGDDRLYGEGDNDQLTGGLGADTLVGGDGADTLTGGDGADSLVGGAGADALSGGVGDDTLAGGAGADTMAGAEGNDILDYSASGAAVTVDLSSGTASGGDAQGDQFNGVDGITGSSFDDSLIGFDDEQLTGSDIYFNIIHGGDGNDYIDGKAGSDSLFGDAGNDTILGGAGNDSIQGGAGNDSILAGTGADSVDAGDGNDVAVVNAGDGADTLRGGAGTDTLVLANWTSTVTSGTDNITNGTYGSWVVSGDANNRILTNTTNGTTITGSGWEVIVCFATGTRIATARGEVPVEQLRVGDLVVTGSGGAALQPVVWMGRLKAEVARHADRAAVAPVLFTAGSLGRGVPFRDLRVSPDHAMFLDGHLVPARHLVNGTTIVQELWCPAVEYWHVELPAHSVIVSEGALSESYLDDGNRKHFDNGVIATLFKDFESERENGRYDREACYPVLRAGEKLEAIRAKLAQVAAGAAAGKTAKRA